MTDDETTTMIYGVLICMKMWLACVLPCVDVSNLSCET